MAFAVKKDWEDTRPGCCKGSGVGAACDTWKTNCPSDVATLVKDAIKLKAAKDAMTAMLTALLTGEGKLTKAGSGDKTKVEKTKALITDWRNAVKNYGTKIVDEEKKLATANRAAADKVIESAFNITKKYQDLLAQNKKEIKEKVTAVQALKPADKVANAMSDMDRKALLKKVETLATAAAVISNKTDELAADHRHDLVFFREPGAAGIGKTHNLDAKAITELGKRFTEHKTLMDKFELDCKTIKMLAHQINVDQTTIAQLLDKSWDLVKGYEKVLQQVLFAVLETKKGLSTKANPGTSMKKLTKDTPRNAVELQVTNCQVVIDTYRKAKKRLDDLTEKGLGHVPSDFRGPLMELVNKIQGEMKEFNAAKEASDKEANEGLVHGQKLLSGQ